MASINWFFSRIFPYYDLSLRNTILIYYVCTYIDLYLFLQVLALVPVYLLQICYGMNTGFPAILTPQLRENCSEFSITSDQESWIVSIDNLATPLICILSGFLQQKFGPQRVIIKYFLHWNNNFDVKSCFVGVFFHSQINFFFISVQNVIFFLHRCKRKQEI